MAEVIGVVSEIPVFKTKTGKNTYSLVVNGKKYSAGFDQPKCNVGDNVSFQTVENGQYTNADTRSLRVLPPAPQSSSAPVKQLSNFGDRQDTISRQAASNTALEFLKLLASYEALDIKKTAKADEKLAALEALLDHYTIQFYERNTGVEYKSIAPTHEKAVESAASEWQ